MTTRAINRLYRVRVVLSALAIVGAVVFLPAANITEVDNDIQAWFAHDAPVVRDYDRFRAEFGGAQPLLIALVSHAPEASAPQDSGMFTRDRLRTLQAISAALQLIPTVRRVQSLATSSVVRAAPSGPAEDDEGLDIGPLLDDLDRRSPRELLALAAADPLLQDDLVSRDGSTVGIIVTFDEEQLEQRRRAIVDRIHDTVAASLPAGVAAHYNGTIEVRDTSPIA